MCIELEPLTAKEEGSGQLKLAQLRVDKLGI